MTVNPVAHPSLYCPQYQSSIDKYAKLAIETIDMEGEEKFQNKIISNGKKEHPILGPEFKKLDQFI